MEWIESESIWLFCPCIADEIVWGETLEGLEPAAEVVGADEVSEMRFELLGVVVMIALDGGFLDGAVHALDLTVGPRMLQLGKTVVDAVFPATHVEHVRHAPGCRPGAETRRERELDAVVGEHGVDLVRHSLDQSREEGRRRGSSRFPDELHEGEFARPI